MLLAPEDLIESNIISAEYFEMGTCTNYIKSQPDKDNKAKRREGNTWKRY